MKASSNRLSGITKELRAQWQDTKAYWKDAKSQEFERRFMRELFAEVNQSVLALEKLDELLCKIRNNCE